MAILGTAIAAACGPTATVVEHSQSATSAHPSPSATQSESPQTAPTQPSQQTEQAADDLYEAAREQSTATICQGYATLLAHADELQIESILSGEKSVVGLSRKASWELPIFLGQVAEKVKDEPTTDTGRNLYGQWWQFSEDISPAGEVVITEQGFEDQLHWIDETCRSMFGGIPDLPIRSDN